MPRGSDLSDQFVTRDRAFGSHSGLMYVALDYKADVLECCLDLLPKYFVITGSKYLHRNLPFFETLDLWLLGANIWDICLGPLCLCA